jgi:hypothetical protein
MPGELIGNLLAGPKLNRNPLLGPTPVSQLQGAIGNLPSPREGTVLERGSHHTISRLRDHQLAVLLRSTSLGLRVSGGHGPGRGRSAARTQASQLAFLHSRFQHLHACASGHTLTKGGWGRPTPIPVGASPPRNQQASFGCGGRLVLRTEPAPWPF